MASSGCAFSFAVRAARVEALACWFEKHAWVEGGGRESPGMRVTFFCFAKRKSPKKRRPPVCDPFAVRRGKPASCRLRGAPWNSLCACGAPLGQPRRVSSRGMGASTPMLTPQPPRRRRSQQGWEQNIQTAGHPFGPSLRSAQVAQHVALAPARLGRAKQRPVWMFCSLCPSGCAEERRVWRIRARDCLSEASSSETPPNPSTAGCPGAKRRGRRQWGRPFFGPFLSATRKKGTRMPGDSRPPPSVTACHSMSTRPQD